MNVESQLRWAACLGHELHPLIRQAVGLNFVGEQFDLATFAAMKQVELRVRQLAGASPSDVGVDLVRKAFHPDSGVLTDLTAARGEREAMSHLFAGAMGVFKNPGSHRRVEFAASTDAAEIILLADLLMRILDRQASGGP